jgi:ribonuclease P protein component
VLANKNRFNGRGSLSFAYRKGDTARGNYFSVKFTKTNNTENFRVAVVVSKKVAKSAPVRNRIRRRIYEIIRLAAPTTLNSQDIIITAFDDRLATMPYTELYESIFQQLEQIKARS